MATIRARGKRWQAEVYRHGQRRAKSFDTKSEARAWAAREVTAIDVLHAKGAFAEGHGRTFRDLLTRYQAEVTPAKRGARHETLRIDALLRDELADVTLAEIDAPHIAAWRDRRLGSVTGPSVRREMTVINAACVVAVREWKWLTANPCTGVTRPKDSDARERRISDREIAALLHVCAWAPDDAAQIAITAMQRVAGAFLFAIETAMRASEICGLTAVDVDRDRRVARLAMTKNGYGRNVPLSPAALAVLARLPETDGPLFGVTPATLDALFRKAKAKAMIEGLHFHDTRHEAVSRLALKLDVLDLARMTGHRDPRMLFRYYHRDAADVAALL